MDESRDDSDLCLDFMEIDWDSANEEYQQAESEAINSLARASSSSSSSSSSTTSSSASDGDCLEEEKRNAAASNLQDSHEPDKNDASDDESMVELDAGVHPLLFPDVVKDVLTNLTAKDVESCRLVCRIWNTEACKVLRSKRLVVLVDSDAVRVYNSAMRNTPDYPHAQFELCMQDFTSLVDENMKEFWTLFGSHIRSLEFRQCHLFWRDFLEVIEGKVPHLERLTIKHLPRMMRSRNPVEDNHQVPSVKELRLASIPSSPAHAKERLTDLLKTLPNLETIGFLPMKFGAIKTKVSNVIVDILRKPEISLPHLRNLNLTLELSSEQLEGLAAKRFQFERLSLSLNNGAKANAFKDLLNSVRPTLSELKINFPDTFSNYQSFTQNNSMKPEECVQVLTNLKSLNMTNFRGSINFVQNLPQLESLEFTTANLENSIPFGFKRADSRSSFGLTRVDDHNLKLLKATSTSQNFTIAETLTLESISRCFPFLTCLKLQGIDDDGLGVIYRNLPFLSDVEFAKATCTDQGITGIPLEICNDMVETTTIIVVQAEKYRRDLFIGSLQFLRRFSIVATCITDASIALGLVDCKNLKELKIGSPLITDTGVIFVTDKFHKQLHCLDVSECSEITECSKYYASEKLVGQLIVADLPHPADSNKTQTKNTQKEVVPNPDRGIVRTKKQTATGFGASTVHPHSKFILQETEFFEEHSDEEFRERGFQHAPFPPDHNNRLRIIRIREALRRNEEFMRNLHRMGLQQFRRLYGREVRDDQEEERERLPAQPVPMLPQALRLARRRGIPQVRPGGIELAEPPLGPLAIEFEDDIFEENRAIQVVGEARALNNEIVEAAVLEEDDGGPAAGDMGPDRLPDIHLAEVFRLGLRLDDVEYWIRNRAAIEREANAPAPVDPPVLRQIRADVLFAGMNLGEEDGALGGVVGGEDEDIDLEAIRRVVMNAFGEDLPFEG